MLVFGWAGEWVHMCSFGRLASLLGLAGVGYSWFGSVGAGWGWVVLAGMDSLAVWADAWVGG